MNLVEWAQRKQGYKEKLCIDFEQLEKDIKYREEQKNLYIQVRDLFASVGKATQDQLIGYFEKLGTSMLRTIYGDEYRFGLKFEIKRNKSECKVLVFKNDIELNIKEEETGCGVIDVVSFSMRLAIWSLTRPRTEPLFILDEPFKFVKGEGKLELVGQVLQELSKSLGIQIIMASHDNALIEVSDTAHRITIENDISRVERVK